MDRSRASALRRWLRAGMVMLVALGLVGQSALTAVAAEGPYLVKDLRADGPSNPRSLTPVGARVFFTAANGVTGRELYVSDGSAEGTRRVKDVWTGKGSANPSQLTALGERLFFIARDGVNGPGLYVTTGSAASTKRLIKRRSCGSESDALLAHRGRVWFALYDNQSLTCDLYSSDGTAAGTTRAAQGIPGFHLPVSFNAKVYFLNSSGPDGRLFVSNGTQPGTKLVKKIQSGWLAELTASGTLLYFAAGDGALWKSDGTAAGTRRIGWNTLGLRGPSALTDVKGTLFFSAHREVGGSVVDDGLWKTKGTAAKTKLMREFGPGSGSVDPHNLVTVGSRLYFAVDDGEHGVELWRSDGTKATTALVADLGPNDSAPRELTALGDRVYFVACFPLDTCWQLYVSDGTAAGTRALDGVVSADNLAATSTSLFLTGRDPAWQHAGELFRYVP